MHVSLSDNARELLALLNNLSFTAKKKMFIGVDGFVDQIIHVVDKRQDFESYARVETISDFGERISRAAGLSTNVEMVTIATKLGGNGPIYANALISLGNNVSYIGALGAPSINPVFENMAGKCHKVYSICEPGYSDALEFDDGKLIFGKHSSLKEVTWETFKETTGGLDKLVEIISECDLFGLENWTMMPYMSNIWEGLINEVFPLLTDKGHKPLAFFDLADPEKRTKADICMALSLISRFEQKFRVILGLNEKELMEISAAFNITKNEGLGRFEFLKELTTAVYDRLGIYCLVVHPVKEATCCVNGEFFYTEGPHTQKPLLTTGAGDNFNAGFCFGQVLGLSPLMSLTMGVSTSGYYVRKAKSPELSELNAFLEDISIGQL